MNASDRTVRGVHAGPQTPVADDAPRGLRLGPVRGPIAAKATAMRAKMTKDSTASAVAAPHQKMAAVAPGARPRRVRFHQGNPTR